MTATGEERAHRTWTVGELADELGVTTRTLRHYEAEGLLTPRRIGPNRAYDDRDRIRLRLILRGRRIGMSLAECREIVDMYDGAESSERRQLATLLERLDELTVDLRRREDDIARTLRDIAGISAQCRTRLHEISQ